MIEWHRMCSISLQHIDVSKVGQKFAALPQSPFLNTGVTFAVNQS